MAAGGLLLSRRPGRSAGDAGGPRRVAVLPFENLGVPTDDYFADGITDEIRGKLTSLTGLEMIACGSSIPYRKTAKAPAEMRIGRWAEALEHLQEADRLDPRSVANKRRLGFVLLYLRRSADARAACDRGLALAPANLALIEWKAMTYLAEGGLARALSVSGAPPAGLEPTALVAFFATYQDLVWVLTTEQQDLLLRLTPAAFDGNRGAWGIHLAQASALRRDAAKTHFFAEEARKAYEEQLRGAPGNAQQHTLLGVAMAYLGRRTEAVQEGERGVALLPVSKDAYAGAYMQHQLVRIHILIGENEKALDVLEPLLKIPYVLSPGWLRIDPTFDLLRGNRRFERLVEQGESGSLKLPGRTAVYGLRAVSSSRMAPGKRKSFSRRMCR